MPRSLDRRGHLVDANEFEAQKEAERQARLDRFTAKAGGLGQHQSTRDVVPLDSEPEWEPPEFVRSHDPHTLEAMRARLVEARNSRG